VLASDASADVEHTRGVVYVRDEEFVVVRRASYQIYLAPEHALCGDHSLTPGGCRPATNPISPLERSLEEIENADRPYFKLKEFTIETLAGALVEVEHAGEFRYRRPILCRGDVLVAI
jgi:glucosamine 6-phosphate synthetase-like amidotransferase/phosphosugar isomerase protein